MALITGASSGIGRAAVLAFARDGVDCCGMARRAERLDELAAEVAALPEPHGRFIGVTGDVGSSADCEAAVARTVEAFGRLDILVANAGVGQRGAFSETSWDHLETLLRTNIDGMMHSIRAVVPAMRASGGGHIMTISSVAASLTSPYAATYAASKAFVSSLSRSLRIELARDGIIISDFLIGRTDTEFNEKRLGSGPRKNSRIPAMRPERVAQALVHTSHHPKNTVILRLLDRLIVLGNALIPGIMGRLAARQYK